jgi:transcriptional regulator of heat shock response
LKFDGGQLSDEQKQLRQFYGDILALASSKQAIARGKYTDLTNYNQQKGNMSAFVHAFARYHQEEKLIIVSNFDSKMEAVKVEIPKELANEIGLSEGTAYVGRDLLRSGAEIGINEKLTMSMEIPAFSSYILKIK